MSSAILAGEKARWAVAAVAAVVITSAVLLLFRSPPPAAALTTMASPAAKAPPPKPFMQLVKSATDDAVLAEELILRDMRPLFLPTDGVNVTLPEPRREPGKTFLDNETLKFVFAEADLNLGRDFPPAATLNSKPVEKAEPADLLTVESGGAGALGFGRREIAVVAAEPRGGFIEVVAAATGHVVVSEPLPLAARPPADKPWEPMELFAVVDAIGLAAPLVVTTSSRVEEIDVHFRSFLARRYRLGERLPPGFYRIIIGP